MAYSVGAAGTLFHVNYKINTQERGFNMKFHMVGADYPAVFDKANLLSGYLKRVMPADAAIFYATLTKDDTKRDSRFLRAALGQGTVPPVVGPPAIPSVYDMPQVCVLIRFENTEGDAVSRKINPIPDSVVSDALLGASVADVVGMPAGPIGAVGTGADYYANLNLLMQILVANTVWVKAGHAPGAAFSYSVWQNAFLLRTGIKKGGRVFTS